MLEIGQAVEARLELFPLVLFGSQADSENSAVLAVSAQDTEIISDVAGLQTHRSAVVAVRFGACSWQLWLATQSQWPGRLGCSQGSHII